ncbi:guanine-1-methyltransferase-domain-containing protein [Fomitopsis serialis]|uniref:guanine-1-methyltransferase-domain-containing protein n=1 Tax=Fomitopsis serialis TaxID=139415 RepID=UPI0020077264|nr:guanine-1-methyltransferase-domain-containing protein [Neoantrodia serialis]KAH9927300.1 guanine-1-methyltransferase-domain-containing protein [Neoantrodia serialis]
MQPETEQPAPSAESAADSPATTEQPASEPAQPLSKNAQKRLAKAAHLAEQKKERRAAEKERRKEKKRILAEKRAAGELDEDEDARARKKRRMGAGPKRPFKARVVVDLGFDDKMTDNEVKSLTSQLAYTYSANRKAEQPFERLLFTSLDGRTYTRMEETNNAAYKRWVNAEWWTEGYQRLWEQPGAANGESSADEQSLTSGEGEGTQTEVAQPLQADSEEGATKGKGILAGNGAADGDSEQQAGCARSGREGPPSSAPKESVVYLTADSQDELAELKEGETYIIGGLCDHNRYKNICFDKAESSGIRSARLPIGTYLASLKTRKVLTVNQTFEILLKWVETRNWEEALEAVIPKRKFATEGRRRGGKASRVSEAGNEEGDEDEMVAGATEIEGAEQAGKAEANPGGEERTKEVV